MRIGSRIRNLRQRSAVGSARQGAKTALILISVSVLCGCGSNIYVWQDNPPKEVCDELPTHINKKRQERGGVPFFVRTYQKGCKYGKSRAADPDKCYDLYLVNARGATWLAKTELTVELNADGTLKKITTNAEVSDRIVPGLPMR